MKSLPGGLGLPHEHQRPGSVPPYSKGHALLVERKGNVVNVSSVNGLRAFPNVLAYCASKAALDQFTHCVALEMAPKGVRINAVNPGVTLTHLHRVSGMNDEAYAAFLERSKTTHPLGRVGQPEEVADLIFSWPRPKPDGSREGPTRLTAEGVRPEVELRHAATRRRTASGCRT